LVLGDAAPDADFVGMPRLTVQMCAVLQGLPQDWIFLGGKTAAYRQVACPNCCPGPVASAYFSSFNRSNQSASTHSGSLASSFKAS
jgi:DNA (cytosine-5)-methyltransferase 1